MKISMRLVLAGCLIFLAAACGETATKDSESTAQNNGATSNANNGGDGSQATAGEPASDCPQRCADKFNSCQAPNADQACNMLCPHMTEEKLVCMEGETCEALAQGDPCNILGGGDGEEGGESGGTNNEENNAADQGAWVLTTTEQDIQLQEAYECNLPSENNTTFQGEWNPVSSDFFATSVRFTHYEASEGYADCRGFPCNLFINGSGYDSAKGGACPVQVTHLTSSRFEVEFTDCKLAKEEGGETITLNGTLGCTP